MATVENHASAAKPPILMSDIDYDCIAEMALRIQKSDPVLSKLVLDEIDRASIHPEEALPKDVVAINSDVEFLDESTGNIRQVRLVLPSKADLGAGRISVMTPVGAGLIGMRAGSEIDWPCPDGRPRILKILAVTQGRG
jgi:regulator of nucleoside diphosphate kinase